MAVTFTKNDLQYLLTQIQMAETNTPPVSPHLAFGLRELAGTNNNTVPGQSTFGSADQPFAHAADPLLQNQYVGPGTVTPGSFVVDGAPRLISNLIADISENNPAALQAAQDFAAQLGDGYTTFNTNPNGFILPGADGKFGTADDNWGFGVDGKEGTADDLWGADGKLGGGDDLTAADKNNLFIGNVTPDAGLSAPFNNWMTFFGQFFDHGLDLISKGGNGYVYIPLAADDPLRTLGPDGIAGNGDEVPLGQDFMLMPRASRGAGADGVLGTSDDTFTNQTSPFVDQSQTYASDGSHNAFLREYTIGSDGKLHTTGKMLQHTTGAGVDGIQGDKQGTLVDESADDARSGMATWGDLKANALKFGLQLLDKDVGDVPLLATDAYGNYIPGPNGHVQVIVNLVGGANPGPHSIELDPTSPLTLDGVKALAEANFPGSVATVLHTGHAFINDMAHNASPFDDFGNLKINGADTDTATGLANADASSTSGFYDNELLDAHYVAGDGRINENIALTTVHEIFHAEHNRLIDQVKTMVRAELANGDTAFASDWVLAGTNLADGIQENEWNGERLMQVAKFGTETQYQHLVFEEFARKVAPTIHLFGNNDIHLNPAITSEFANAVYRFGHSMLDENVPRYALNPDGTMKIDSLGFLDALGQPTATDLGFGSNPNFGKPILTDMGLIEAFTNPLAYAGLGDTGAAQIVQGTTHQIGSEIDEFVTGSLRNNLLGLPLDLAALNIARGRETGVPPINLLRAQIYDSTHDQTLKPYASWDEFRQFLKHDASIINFVAAYGMHSSITGATTLEAKRAAALQLVTWGVDPASATGDAAHQDAYNFMHSLGAWANNTRNLGGDSLNNTADDTWVGGPNAGNALHDASGHAIVWATGSVTGLDSVDLWIAGLAEKQNLFGGLLGSTFNFIFETQLESLQDADRLYYLPRIEGMDFGFQIENNSFADMIIANTGARHIPASIFLTPEYTVEASTYFDVNGNPTDQSTWLRNPVTGALLVEVLPDHTVHFIGDDNFFGNTMVLGGTEGDDRLVAGHADDDTVWGDGGNDFIDGGNGNDFLYGGTGNDTIVDSGGDDVIHGEAGNDWINGGIGDDIIFGGDGNDYIETGYSILGDEGQGGAGNDIIIGGDGDDALIGQEGDDWLEGGAGGDGLVGDIGAPTGMVPLYSANDVLDGGLNGDKMVGFSGDDIMLGEGGFDKFNGLLGFDWADFEKETHGVSVDMERREFIPNQQQPAGDAVRDFFVETEATGGSKWDDFIQGTEDAGKAAGVFNELTNVDLIFNLNTFFVGGGAYDWDATGNAIAGSTAFSTGNILLGGDGSDTITGRAGNDIIDGDAWLHVELSQRGVAGADIIREIRFDTTDGDTDTAVFRGNIADYTVNLVPDAEGFITVTHNGLVAVGGGAVPVRFTSDGTDRLRNIERLQFADATINIDPSPTADLPPTGTPFITGNTVATPIAAVVGTPLTIVNPALELLNPLSTISALLLQDADNVTIGNPNGVIFTGVDPDGAGPATAPTFQWQELIFAAPGGGSAWIDINGATGQTYTPRNGDLGFQLRVVETYTDMKGIVERVASAPTVATTANLAVNTAPFVVAQQNPSGLPDTVAKTNFPVNIFLPLTVTFGDNETAANLLTFTAKFQNTGVALTASPAVPVPGQLYFDLVPDLVNGGFSGAFIHGTVSNPGDIPITITATDGGPGTPLSVTDTFNIHVQTGNLSPVLAAAPESFAATEDTAFNGTLLAGTDPDAPSVAPVFRLVAGSAVNGTVSLNSATGAYVFTPSANLSSQDSPVPPTFSFQYRLFDGLTFSAIKTVTGTVNHVDDGVAPISITGTAAAGGTLSAVIGADPDGAWISGSESYQWFRDGVAIGGATSADLVLTAADVGHTFAVEAGYTDGQGFVYAPSATTESVTTAPVGVVGVNGIPGGGVPPRIAAFNTLSDPDGGPFPDSVSYNWETSLDGITWTPANPASVSVDTLTFTPAVTTAAGAFVRVTVVYIDGLGNLDTATSGSTHYIVDPTSANIVLGTAAGELIFGNGGADQITGGAGDDFVQGGNGADTFFASIADGNDSYDGGNGSDTYNLSLTSAAATVNLAAGTAASAQTGTDTLLSVENVVGSTGNDSITGNGNANVLRGGGGIDTLNGAGGSDTAAFTASVANYAFSLSGGNLVVTDTRGGSPDGASTLISVENLQFAAQSLALVFGNNNNNAAINGGNADEILLGLDGNDTLNGNGGDDTLIGGNGTDVLLGGAGNDTIVASIGDGNDTINGGTNNDTLDLSAGTVAETVNLGSAAAQNISAQFGTDTLSNIENVIGGSAGDTLTGANNVANVIQGGGGNDILNGGTGTGTDTAVFSGPVGSYGFALSGTSLVVTDNRAGSPDGQDTLSNFEAVQFGTQTFTLRQGTNNAAADTLTGANGSDLLLGFNGNDTLDGNGGADVMAGGAGVDRFFFDDNDSGATAATRDSILDFVHLTDHVDLSGIDAIAGGADQAFIFDVAAKAGSGLLANQHVGYFHTTIDGQDHTIIEGNIQGANGAVDFQIDLVGNITLTATDFIL